MKNAFISALRSDSIIKFIESLISSGFSVYSLNHDFLDLSGTTVSRADIRDLNFDLIFIDLFPVQSRNQEQPLTIPPVDFSYTQLASLLDLRSIAAKQVILVDRNDLGTTEEWLREGCPFPGEFRKKMLAKAEFVLAQYFLKLAIEHGEGRYKGQLGELVFTCKYGENAYQVPAGFYRNPLSPPDPLDFTNFRLIFGQPLSYNNIGDLNRLTVTMTRIAAAFDKNRQRVPHIALVVKHCNACGAAFSFTDPAEAVKKMVLGDQQAIFGGLVMTNFTVDEEIAELLLHYKILEGKRLFDSIFAPEFKDDTVQLFKRKEGKCRLADNPALFRLGLGSLDYSEIIRGTRNNHFLNQPNYSFVLDFNDPDLKRFGPPLTLEQENDLLLAKSICDTTNSNTSTLVRDGQLIGNAASRQSRHRSVWLACEDAIHSKHLIPGAVLATDSFFPFADGAMIAKQYGANIVLASSGSRNDQEVIDFCEQEGMSLLMIPDAKGRGFCFHD